METISKPCKKKYIVTSKPIEDQTIYRNQDLFCWQLNSITKIETQWNLTIVKKEAFVWVSLKHLEESTENQKTELDRSIRAFEDSLEFTN